MQTFDFFSPELISCHPNLSPTKNPRPKKIGIVYAVRVRPAAVDIRNTAGNARSIDG